MTAPITYHFRIGFIPSADLARFGESLNNGDSRLIAGGVLSGAGQLWERLAERDELEHGKATTIGRPRYYTSRVAARQYITEEIENRRSFRGI